MKTITIIIGILLAATSANASAYGNLLTKQDFEFIKKLMNGIQVKSFEQNAEFCGYIYLDKNDELSATEPTKGDADSCLATEPDEALLLVNSYHTHGAFSVDADTEIPSSNDIFADADEGVDGIISTPGGRIWYIDSQKEFTSTLCDENCVLQDKNYDASLIDPVEKFYTLQDLRDREEMD